MLKFPQYHFTRKNCTTTGNTHLKEAHTQTSPDNDLSSGYVQLDSSGFAAYVELGTSIAANGVWALPLTQSLAAHGLEVSPSTLLPWEHTGVNLALRRLAGPCCTNLPCT